jgi:hypothetical protein
LQQTIGQERSQALFREWPALRAIQVNVELHAIVLRCSANRRCQPLFLRRVIMNGVAA